MKMSRVHADIVKEQNTTQNLTKPTTQTIAL